MFEAWSLSFDWSGFTRLEGYYQNSSDHNYYGDYHFVLQPKIHVVDGLSVIGRLDLNSLGETLFSPSEAYRQTGLVLLYAENSKRKELDFKALFFTLSQIYLDYETEFFKIRLGRAPYHFGMGVSYFASQNPFQHWVSVYDQLSVYLEYAPFYLQPSLFYQKENSALGVLQAGLLKEDWELKALVQYDFKDHSLAELFGQYKKANWEIKSSVSYVFQEEINMAFALEASAKIPATIPVRFEIKTGGAFGDFLFHPNYDLALLFGNRYITEQNNLQNSDSAFVQIAQGQVQNSIYLSPRLLFSVLNDNLKIRPLLLLARGLDSKKFDYEFDLEGIYQLDESLFFSLKGGLFYTEKEFLFALLAQTAVSF